MQAEGPAGAGSGIPLPVGGSEWSGRAGLARIRRRIDCAVPDPDAFSARTRVMASQGMTFVEWRSTPATVEWVPETAEQCVCLSVLLQGDAAYETGGGTWRAVGTAAYAYRFAGRIRFALVRGALMRSLLLPVSVLPPALRAGAALPEGVLQPTTLVRAFAAVLQVGFGDALERGRLPSGLPYGLRGLAAGVLEEAGVETVPDDGTLRSRILIHVDQHLGDPALGPQTIADALGVSLRWVHRSFNGGGTTLAKHIRERRVEAVALHARASRDRPRLNRLAPTFGFASRDQLTRAFSARHGMTVGEYWELHTGG